MNNNDIQTAIELNNSRDIYARRAGNHSEVHAALDFFYEEIQAEHRLTRADHIKKYRHQIRVFVLDLFVANQIDPQMYITFPRGKRAYSKGHKHHRMRLSQRVATNIADYLESRGYIEQRKGFYDKQKKSGKITRIRATEKFTSLLTHDYGVEAGMYMWLRDTSQPTLILKNQDKNAIEYDDTDETLAMKSNLELINSTLERHSILLHVSDAEYKEMCARMAAKSHTGRVDFTRKYVRRVFNNSSWEQGGRFYGGWWQQIPREYRQHIRLNDKDVVECDYSGLHINMLYAMENLPVPDGDVYDIPEYPESSHAFRNFVKRLLLTIVNSADKESARKALNKSVYFDKDLKLPEEIPSIKAEDIFPLLDAFSRKHQGISHYFCTGKGIDLQFMDSQIAERIMVRFSELGYPILPMHDSFIIHHGLEPDLKECMNEEFQEMFKSGIQVDLKYNSIEERQATEPQGYCGLSLEELLEEVSETGEYGLYNNLLNQFRRYAQEEIQDEYCPSPSIG